MNVLLASFQVLQRSVDRELCLYTDLKEQLNCVAQVMMISLTSQPVDHLENGRQKPHTEAGKLIGSFCSYFESLNSSECYIMAHFMQFV
jgi:hypothetical protein